MVVNEELYVVELGPEILEESRRFVAELEARTKDDPPIFSLPAAETRERRAAGLGSFPPPVLLAEAQTREISGRSGQIGFRVFVPREVRGVYLHIHGGGWVLGAASEQDPMLHELATSVGVAVVSVDYRLAPEHPFPAALEDCVDAARWLIEHTVEEFGNDALLIGGESAGAHLAVMTMLALRDRYDGAGAFRGANLSYGVFDLSMTPSARQWGARNLVLSTPTMAWYVQTFLGERAANAADPEFSPLYSDLSGLPSALFSVGSEDLLLDDTRLMAARWQQAGNTCRCELYESAPHGFLRLPIGLAAVARARQFGFLADLLNS